jgi:hypothetical protein
LLQFVLIKNELGYLLIILFPALLNRLTMRKDCRIKVYTVLGEKVYQSAEGALEGLSVVEVGLRPVRSGGYFVVVECPEGRLIQRMIVN